MTEKTDKPVGRRDFLKFAATSAPLAAAATVAGTSVAEAAEPDPSSDRIQDTAQVRTSSASARF